MLHPQDGEPGALPGFRLSPTGRFQHSQPYLEAVAERNGWRVLHLSQTVIRQNAGKPVHGHVVVAERSAGVA